MTIQRTLVRIFASFSLLVLAACQTTPSGQTDAAVADQATTAETAQRADQDTAAQQQASAQGAPVAVFLASTDARDGWQPVQLDVGNLYLNPQPVVIRDDLTGVQAGASEEGDGLLALELSPSAQSRVTQATTEHPNMRLALIIGQTMLAAPGYTDPVTTPHLIFVVGTEENAMAAARAIAGVPADGSADQQGAEGARAFEAPAATQPGAQ